MQAGFAKEALALYLAPQAGIMTPQLWIAFFTGGSFIVFVTHFILYLYRREKVLLLFALYVLGSFLLGAYRVAFWQYGDSDWRTDLPFFHRLLYEPLQLFSMFTYAVFWSYAISINRLWSKFIKGIFILYFLVYGSYFLFHIIGVGSGMMYNRITLISSIIRVFTLLTGVVILVWSWRKNTNGPYFQFLRVGFSIYVVLGIVALFSYASRLKWQGLYGLDWLMMGLFIDTIVFSLAIGYRIQKQFSEREAFLEQLRVTEAELKDKEIEQVKAVFEERERIRQRIAGDLHDDVGASLTSISLLSEVALQHREEEKRQQALRKIGEYSREMINNLSDIVWAINPQNDSLTRMTDRMKNFAQTLLSSRNIQLFFLVDDEVLKIFPGMIQRKNLYLVFKESINNAVKYAECSSIRIHMKIKGSTLEMGIADDGKGFEPGRNGSGQGIDSMYRRAEDVGGNLMINSAVGKGTLVLFQMPVDRTL